MIPHIFHGEKNKRSVNAHHQPADRDSQTQTQAGKMKLGNAFVIYLTLT